MTSLTLFSYVLASKWNIFMKHVSMPLLLQLVLYRVTIRMSYIYFFHDNLGFYDYLSHEHDESADITDDTNSIKGISLHNT